VTEENQSFSMTEVGISEKVVMKQSVLQHIPLMKRYLQAEAKLITGGLQD
jgi:hypothetical protein